MSANAAFSELITSTYKRRDGKVADNVTNNNALLTILQQKGNIVLEDGGETLVSELDYAENGTFKYYSGYELLDVSDSDILSAAEYDWKNAAVSIVLDGPRIRKNKGSKTRVINLMKTKIKNAERTMANNLSTGIYSDGTGSAGKEIGGLQLLVADSPTTGTVGGIDRASFEFWRNKKYSGTGDGGGAVSSSNIQDYMNALYLDLVRGTDTPDLIVAGTNYYNFYWQSLQAIQRITDGSSATSGFKSLEFAGPNGMAKVVYDSTCNTNRMYFLNTDYMEWRVHTDANYSLTDSKEAVNQDAVAKQILFMGNLTMSNASLQGVLIA